MTTNPKLSHKSLSILSNYDKTFRTISENCFRFYSVLFHVYLKALLVLQCIWKQKRFTLQTFFFGKTSSIPLCPIKDYIYMH